MRLQPPRMKRVSLVLAALAIGSFPPSWAAAEESAGSTAQELQLVEKLLERQSKQLDILTEQVSKLTLRLEAHDAGASEPAPAEPAPATSPAQATPEVPRAEATGGGIKHLVARGETLTSVAKHYNIPLADLQKANKNVNDRKLQIGQVLNIPASATPESPAAPEKKETP